MSEIKKVVVIWGTDLKTYDWLKSLTLIVILLAKGKLLFEVNILRVSVERSTRFIYYYSVRAMWVDCIDFARQL